MDTLDFYGLLERLTPEQFKELRQCKLDIAYTVWTRKKPNFDNETRIIKDVNNMAREAKKTREVKLEPTKSESSPKKSTTWVDYPVRTKDEKNSVREFGKDVDTVLDQLVMLLDEGYDLVCKRSDNGATVRSMLFCNIGGHPHNGLALSAAAPDAWTAIVCLVYKHTVGLQGVWTGQAGDDDGDAAW